MPFFMLPLLTGHLSTSEFGMLMLVEVTILVVSPFVLSNLPGAVNSEYVHLTKTEFKDYITNALMLALAAFFLTSFVVSALGWIFPRMLVLPFAVWACIPLLASLKIVGTVVLGIFQMRQEPYKFGLLVFVQVLIDLGLSYLLVAVYNMGLYGRLGGVYSGFFISMMIGLMVLKRMDLFSFKYVRHYSAKILSFTMPLIPHTLAGAVLAMSDRYFLASMVGENSVGVYGVAYQAASIMMLVAMSVCQAWNPFLFRLLKAASPEANKKIRLTVSLMICSFLVAGMTIYASSDYFFKWFVDEKYFEAKLFFPWLLIGFMCQAIYLLFSSKFFYYKKTAKLAMLTTIFAAFNLLLNYILIGRYGVLGAAYSTAITWFLAMLCVALFSLRQFTNTSIEVNL